MKLLAALAVSAAVLVASTSARADETEAPAPVGSATKEAPVKPTSHWYGYQTMASDGAALAMFAISATADAKGAQTGFGVASLATYALVPAIIHGVHGSPGKGIGDVAIRVVGPVLTGLLGMLIGSAIYQPSHAPGIDGAVTDIARGMSSTIEGGEIGVVTGVVLASALDAAVLSREEVAPARRPAPVAKALTVNPSAGPTRGGFSAGLSGTF